MIQTEKLNKAIIYFDLEKRAIGRAPTQSNMKNYGADNSLYFGIVGKSSLEEPIKKILRVEDLNQASGRSFPFCCYGEDVSIVLNINAEGQIQLKFDGTSMFMCFAALRFESPSTPSWEDYIIVLDFEHLRMMFKPKKDLELV